MNGPGWAMLGFVGIVGLCFAASWRFAASRHRGVSDRSTRTRHVVASAGVLAAVVVVPAVAKPGSQPGWSLVVMILIMPAVITAVRDLSTQA